MLAFLRRLFGGGPDPREAARLEAERIVQDAEAEARSKVIEGQEQTLDLRGEMEAQVRDERQEAQRHEDRLAKREDSLERKGDDLDKREGRLRNKEQSIDERLEEIDAGVRELLERCREGTS